MERFALICIEQHWCRLDIDGVMRFVGGLVRTAPRRLIRELAPKPLNPLYCDRIGGLGGLGGLHSPVDCVRHGLA